jgi:ABC-type Fe3+/spermidine/putrescine transport system ATPase subunit
MVSLSGHENKKPRQLSGGQQQRVALARAIVCNPKVLLLDEPLSALDAKLREAMQLELRQLHQKLGMTFIFVTHDQSEALTMSDRIAVMSHGKIEQIGAPMEVYLRPTSTFVASFVGQANLLRGADLKFEISENPRVLVRPERVRVSARPESEEDIPVKILDVIFSGPTVRLVLRMHTGVGLTALSVEGEVDDLRPGMDAFCRIAREDVHVLPQA